MTKMKTPGVYIIEKNAFPNSVVEVATAVPAFIGYTEKAENGSQSLLNVPFRISSLSEYERYFGGAAAKTYTLSLVADDASVVEIQKKIETESDESNKKKLKDQLSVLIHSLTDLVIGDKPCLLTHAGNLFTFYEHIKLFFANGGGNCYIVSVGDYSKKLENANFENGINVLEREQDPTIIVIPEAVNGGSCFSVYQNMLQHCGKMKNRFAILDIPEGYKERKSGAVDVIESFRTGVGSGYLNFASAYYPWLHTSVTDLGDLGLKNLSNNENSFLPLIYKTKSWGNDKELAHFVRRFELNDEFGQIEKNAELASDVKNEAKKKVAIRIVAEDPIASAYLKEICNGADPTPENNLKAAQEKLPNLSDDEKMLAVAKWWKQKEIDKSITTAIGKKRNLLPPSAAMAGLYTQVDNSRGVWKAPANVSLNYVVAPAVEITDLEQEDLNMTNNGKSVNAIRSFIGSGIKVWGARTLDGNNLNWSYINVRRTMIFLEASIKNAAQSYVFEPNEANTWLNMKCMIENFLRGIWKRGGLAGASPEDAYSVRIGLGETMTPEDILEGIMRITVLVAISHPAEFVEITFQQQMQKS